MFYNEYNSFTGVQRYTSRLPFKTWRPHYPQRNVSTECHGWRHFELHAASSEATKSIFFTYELVLHKTCKYTLMYKKICGITL